MCKVGIEFNRILTSQHARGIRSVATWWVLQHAAKQMTNPWNSPAFAHEAPPCAQRCCSRFRLRRDVNAFYFGVLRCVAKGNTGGATGAENKGREGLLEAAYWLRRAVCAFA